MQFGYTILFVDDVPGTVEFYRTAFGIQPRFVHESGQYGELETGATTLAFVSDEFARSNGTPHSMRLPWGQSPAMEIGFVTADVETAYKLAVNAGAEPLAEPRQKPWGQTVGYVRDKNGFLVEICSPMGGMT